DASKSKFIKTARDYKILHLGMHGKANQEQAYLSKIYFNKEDSSSLSLREIQSLDLNSDLVVLSACETNVGDIVEGEGPLSLAYAFQYAGANSVLSSLWSVPDDQTSSIMISFYQNLKEGMTKSKALQEAKKSYISKANGIELHPSFWAGFILLGNDEPISTSNTSLKIWLILGSLAIIGFVIAFTLRKKS
ncbi:MAG: CHAT domain-containing protein, partial [Bacteroidota bacterium]